jgi:hypothetical protein
VLVASQLRAIEANQSLSAEKKARLLLLGARELARAMELEAEASAVEFEKAKAEQLIEELKAGKPITVK